MDTPRRDATPLGKCNACGETTPIADLAAQDHHCAECHAEIAHGAIPRVNVNVAGEHGAYAPPHKG